MLTQGERSEPWGIQGERQRALGHQNNSIHQNIKSMKKLITITIMVLAVAAAMVQLTNYVSNQSEYQCGGNSSYIAKALASTEGWCRALNYYDAHVSGGNEGKCYGFSVRCLRD